MKQIKYSTNSGHIAKIKDGKIKSYIEEIIVH